MVKRKLNKRDGMFSREITPCCGLCSGSAPVFDGNFCCRSHGIVNAEYVCRNFEYDPLKRKPPKRLRINDVQDFEFSID